VGVGLETLIWARLEGLVPGEMDKLLVKQKLAPGVLLDWLTDRQKPVRPRLESRLRPKDLAAVEDWSAAQLPSCPAAQLHCPRSGGPWSSPGRGRSRAAVVHQVWVDRWCSSGQTEPRFNPWCIRADPDVIEPCPRE
jgi:hypothetical protein